MPIAALPPETVQVIGASQVLTDSASLVKEVSFSELLPLLSWGFHEIEDRS